MKLIYCMLCISILLASFAFASSIGVSPGKVEILNLLRDGYAEKVITVSTNEIENITVTIELQGALNSWLTLDPPETQFEINRDQPRPITLIVQPPSAVQLGTHTGGIVFTSQGVGDISGRAGGVIRSSILLGLETNLTGTQTIACDAGAFYITDSEVGDPIEVGFTMVNEGNVRLSPTLNIDVWNQYQDELIYQTSLRGSDVLPTVEQQIALNLENNFEVGQYWVTLNAEECDLGTQVSMSILEKGAIADQGTLESIEAKTWAATNETVNVKTTFKNTGPRPVLAKIKGDIQLENVIVDVIETEELQVGVGESQVFEHLFTPRQQGRYVVRARALYNNKLTFEKGTIINARDSEILDVGKFNFWPLLIYLIIFLTIVFLIRRILQQRRKPF